MGIHIVIHITDKLFFFLYTKNSTLISAAHPKPSVLILFSLNPTSSILSPQLWILMISITLFISNFSEESL